MRRLISYTICFAMISASIGSISFAREKDEKEYKFEKVLVTQDVYDDEKDEDLKIEDGNVSVTAGVYAQSELKQSIVNLHSKLVEQDKILKTYLLSFREIQKTANAESAKELLTKLEQSVNAQKEIYNGYIEKLREITEKMKSTEVKGKAALKLREATVLVNKINTQNVIFNYLDKGITALKAKLYNTDLSKAKETINKLIIQGKNIDAKKAYETILSKGIKTKELVKDYAKLLNKNNKNKAVLMINNKLSQGDATPILRDGRTLVPVRAIVDGLKANVKYDPNTKTITILKDGKTVTLKLDSRDVKIEQKPAKIDVPAVSINGRTYVPIRFVSEALKAKVDWDAENNVASIIEDKLSSIDTSVLSTDLNKNIIEDDVIKGLLSGN